ncbi:MAG: hypothetical protein R2789_07350 [Microthrixaceae bacterium]
MNDPLTLRHDRARAIDLIGLGLLALLVRIPAFLSSKALTFDDGVFSLSALAMRDGGIPFADVFSSQGPLFLPLVWLGDLLESAQHQLPTDSRPARRRRRRCTHLPGGPTTPGPHCGTPRRCPGGHQRRSGVGDRPAGSRRPRHRLRRRRGAVLALAAGRPERAQCRVGGSGHRRCCRPSPWKLRSW